MPTKLHSGSQVPSHSPLSVLIVVSISLMMALSLAAICALYPFDGAALGEVETQGLTLSQMDSQSKQSLVVTHFQSDK